MIDEGVTIKIRKVTSDLDAEGLDSTEISKET
jgi:hypothetical protein